MYLYLDFIMLVPLFMNFPEFVFLHLLMINLNALLGRSMVINVEYNQLDPLLRASGYPEGDVNCETGFSPFPGNINQVTSFSYFNIVPAPPTPYSLRICLFDYLLLG